MLMQYTQTLDDIPPVILGRVPVTVPHTIVATTFEREDGMAALRIRPDCWTIRAPIAGQTQFWNGSSWVMATLIPLSRTQANDSWPAEFKFSMAQALFLLETLDAP